MHQIISVQSVVQETVSFCSVSQLFPSISLRLWLSPFLGSQPAQNVVILSPIPVYSPSPEASLLCIRAWQVPLVSCQQPWLWSLVFFIGQVAKAHHGRCSLARHVWADQPHDLGQLAEMRLQLQQQLPGVSRGGGALRLALFQGLSLLLSREPHCLLNRVWSFSLTLQWFSRPGAGICPTQGGEDLPTLLTIRQQPAKLPLKSSPQHEWDLLGSWGEQTSWKW